MLPPICCASLANLAMARAFFLSSLILGMCITNHEYNVDNWGFVVTTGI